MERIELVVAGLRQALRPQPVRDQVPTIGRTSQATPAWLQLVRQQAPFLAEALAAEQPGTGSDYMPARARRLRAERNRLIHRLRTMTPSLHSGCLEGGGSPEELRRALLRLVRDISHHHQRVNDLAYDEGWLDVGGSE